MAQENKANVPHSSSNPEPSGLQMHNRPINEKAGNQFGADGEQSAPKPELGHGMMQNRSNPEVH